MFNKKFNQRRNNKTSAQTRGGSSPRRGAEARSATRPCKLQLNTAERITNDIFGEIYILTGSFKAGIYLKI